jgi:dipeptidyl aminopeptidase/acylaminoacyl peptidase
MRRLLAIISAGLLLAGAACSGPVGPSTPAPSQSTAGSGSPDASAAPQASAPPSAPASARPSTPATPAPRPSQPARKPNPISIAALITKTYDGGDLELGRLLEDRGAYKRYLISYTSEKLTVTGIMHVPDGNGPFPVIVLNHGYIDPDTYRPGQGMPREQDYLARNGYVVLHTDYRGHAGGDDDPDVDYELRLPYAVDTINAVYAVKRSRLPFLDGDRVGWLGRSMGGNVTLNALVAKPGLVDAAVIYASTSSLAADNFRQFYVDSDDRRGVNRRIARGYGLPEDNPSFWRAASPRPFFGRVTEPLLVQHGNLDDTCPISWSRETIRALRAEGKDVRYFFYPREGHTFEDAFGQSIRRTRAFFDAELG